MSDKEIQLEIEKERTRRNKIWISFVESNLSKAVLTAITFLVGVTILVLFLQRG